MAEQFRKQAPLVRTGKKSTLNYTKGTQTLKSTLIVPVAEWEIMEKVDHSRVTSKLFGVLGS